jgi:hypothetical protein
MGVVPEGLPVPAPRALKKSMSFHPFEVDTMSTASAAGVFSSTAALWKEK